jgi:alpha-N-arabinofuranosidase
MVNVLQAMILTDEEKMVLASMYHAFRMYVPFQGASRLAVDYDQGQYKHAGVNLPRVDMVAARGQDGRIRVALTNVDPNRPANVELSLKGRSIAKVNGETFDSPAMDSVNMFDKPQTVAPRTLQVEQAGGAAKRELAPHSVTVVSLDETGA